jgi:membrane protein required for colicin V production
LEVLGIHAFDLAMLGVVLAATIWGAWKGMAWQLAAFASIVLSYVVALKASGPMAEHFSAEAPWNRFLAMLVIYLAVSLIVWLLFRAVHGMIERVKLVEFDRQIGALFGALKGVVLCLAITFFTVTLSEDARQLILTTYSGRYAAQIIDWAHPIMPPEIHDVLEPYIHQLDQDATGSFANQS